VRFLPGLLIAVLLALPAVAGADTTPTCAEGPTTVGGTTYGTPCADVIVVPAGVEGVKAGGGDDTIVPGPIAASAPCPDGCRLGVGSQTFEGGEGDDVVFGERGNDILRGGPGNDQLFGGIGDDLLQGGSGNDRLAGGFGADSIDGQEGDDYVRGDTTIDRIFDSGGGTDTLSYSTGVTPGFGSPADENGVKLELGTGGENAKNGIASNGGGADEVETGVFEVIVGTAFSDEIVGTAMGEAIYGGGSADAIDGGGGADQIFQGAATRDTTKVSVGFMTPPGATPYAQLYLVGSSGVDKLTASYSAAAVTFVLTAGTFDESASGAGGCEIESPTEAVCPLTQPLDSVLVAGLGGADTIAASGFPATVGLVATGGEGADTLTGGEESEDILIDGEGTGADQLVALGRDDALTHNGGADELLGGDGNDLFLSVSICDDERIVGGAGRDNSSWARFKEGGVYADLEAGVAGRPSAGQTLDCGAEPTDALQEVEDLEGSAGGDVFYGDPGPNQLLGHPGPDVYFARAGEDSILANSGDADITIDCGADSDTALIDLAKYGDPAPVECEAFAESEPNNFRTKTELPPPPLEEPTPEQSAPPVVKPPVVKPPRDRQPPQTRLGAHPRAVVYTHRKWRKVAFRFAASEPGAGFRCKLDRKPYRPCVSPRSYRVKAGRHAFRVFAIDAAGNRDRTPVVFSFRVRPR